MRIQFRSSYMGSRDYDVYAPRIVQRVAIINDKTDKPLVVRLTEFGEQHGVSTAEIESAFASHLANEKAKFIAWCAKRDLDPNLCV